MLSNILGSKGTSLAGLIGIVIPLVTWIGGLIEMTPDAMTAVINIVSMVLGGTLFLAKDPNAD